MKFWIYVRRFLTWKINYEDVSDLTYDVSDLIEDGFDLADEVLHLTDDDLDLEDDVLDLIEDDLGRKLPVKLVFSPWIKMLIVELRVLSVETWCWKLKLLLKLKNLWLKLKITDDLELVVYNWSWGSLKYFCSWAWNSW